MNSPLSNPRRQIYDKTYSLLSDPSLPYDDYTKGFILHHLSDLISVSPEIKPRIAKFESGDSPVNVNLLHADVIILYQGSYRTIVICFPVSYPLFCPHVRVTCPDFEVIKLGQKTIAPCGTVSHSYLLNWNHKTSNVRSLVKVLTTEFDRTTPLASPSIDHTLNLLQVKLAKILIENGLNDLYIRIYQLDRQKQKDFFDKITSRYRKHPHLEEFINSTEERVAQFVEIAKEIAKELFPDASKSVDGVSLASSGTRGYHNAVGQQEISSSLQVNHKFSSLTSQTNLRYDEADRSIILKHLSHLVSCYPLLEAKDVNDLIQVYGVIPYSYEGEYYRDVNVIILLLKPYPDTRPRVFVPSCSGICIRNDLLNVSSEGSVYCSYLRNWHASTSNLAGLVSHLSAIFSCQPPHATIRTSPLEKGAQNSSRNIRQQFTPPSQGVHGMVSSDTNSEHQVPADGQGAQHASSTTASFSP